MSSGRLAGGLMLKRARRPAVTSVGEENMRKVRKNVEAKIGSVVVSGRVMRSMMLRIVPATTWPSELKLISLGWYDREAAKDMTSSAVSFVSDPESMTDVRGEVSPVRSDAGEKDEGVVEAKDCAELCRLML